MEYNRHPVPRRGHVGGHHNSHYHLHHDRHQHRHHDNHQHCSCTNNGATAATPTNNYHDVHASQNSVAYHHRHKKSSMTINEEEEEEEVENVENNMEQLGSKRLSVHMWQGTDIYNSGSGIPGTARTHQHVPGGVPGPMSMQENSGNPAHGGLCLNSAGFFIRRQKYLQIIVHTYHRAYDIIIVGLYVHNPILSNIICSNGRT